MAFLSTMARNIAEQVLYSVTGAIVRRQERRMTTHAPTLSGGLPRAGSGRIGPGAAALAASQSSGLEGVVAKKRRSTYAPGRRSDDWRKLKHVRRTSAVVAGWKPGEGGRAGRIGSLIGTQLVLPTFLVVILTGGALALLLMLHTGAVRATMQRVLMILVGLLPGWEMPRFAVPADRKHTIPYGVAITFGSLISLAIFRA